MFSVAFVAAGCIAGAGGGGGGGGGADERGLNFPITHKTFFSVAPTSSNPFLPNRFSNNFCSL